MGGGIRYRGRQWPRFGPAFATRIERHGSAALCQRCRRRRLRAARKRRAHCAPAGRRVFRHHRRRPARIRGDCRGAHGARRWTRQGGIPRLAVGSQSRPMLRRRGQDAHRNFRRERSRGGAAARGGREGGRIRDPKQARRQGPDRPHFCCGGYRRQNRRSFSAVCQDGLPRAIRRDRDTGGVIRRRSCRPRRRACTRAAAVLRCTGSTAGRINFRSTCRATW